MNEVCGQCITLPRHEVRSLSDHTYDDEIAAVREVGMQYDVPYYI